MWRDYKLFSCGMLATVGGFIADSGHEVVGVILTVVACCIAVGVSMFEK